MSRKSSRSLMTVVTFIISLASVITGCVPFPQPPETEDGSGRPAPCPNECCVAADCDDKDACTVDSCLNGKCTSAPVDCDDADACTVDTCANSTCTNQPVVCASGAACDPLSGSCVVKPASECLADSDCDDDDRCTTDTCTGSACNFVPVVCRPGNTCNPASGLCGGASGSKEVLISATWSNSTDEVWFEINWFLPTGDAAPINRCHWSLACAETVSDDGTLATDGLHVLALTKGGGAFTNLDYSVRFLDYTFDYNARVSGSFNRYIGIDVKNGIAKVVFNGYLASEAADSGLTVGDHNVDIIAAFRDAQDDVWIEANLRGTQGEQIEAEKRHHWDRQGFERIVIPSDFAMADGTYELTFQLGGSGDFADISYMFDFLGTTFRYDALMQAAQARTVGIDVHGGAPCVFFNSWVSTDSPENGGMCGRPLEVTAGFENATDDVYVEMNVRLPTGQSLQVWRSHWARNAFERAIWPDGVPLLDGVYTIDFKLGGTGGWADVVLRAKILNWTFVATPKVLSPFENSITVEVRNGVAAELSNGW